jgi:hypothetical protein
MLVSRRAGVVLGGMAASVHASRSEARILERGHDA